MVAENSLSVAPKVLTRKPNTEINLSLEMKCRNLYLIRCVPVPEIATATGLSKKQVRNLVSRRGWTKLKRDRRSAMKERAEARMETVSEQLQDSIASECEEIVMGGLSRAREEITSDSPFAAKNFQAWAGGVRSLAAVARTARGEDGNAQSSGAGMVNVYLVGGERVLKPISASPVPVIELQK